MYSNSDTELYSSIRTVRRSFFINPILFFPGHTFSARDFAGRAGFIERTGFRAVTECLKAVFLF